MTLNQLQKQLEKMKKKYGNVPVKGVISGYDGLREVYATERFTLDAKGHEVMPVEAIVLVVG